MKASYRRLILGGVGIIRALEEKSIQCISFVTSATRQCHIPQNILRFSTLTSKNFIFSLIKSSTFRREGQTHVSKFPLKTSSALKHR